ncbi:MAG: hypothetical protein BGO74_06070 [Burkholderiales bacterium 68-12]|jgi:hypothetical protein|uniref:Uncharacterized protein n=3 Tax=cellular organisms TaxID=131567 RepID=A0A420RST0_GIBIN|nr:hypothetical protein [Acidovorax sp. 210-6]OJX31494.1 MAG: hypothetical protein BGO74_06070 [Burkholderiales bacterium 68-12]POR09646.1 hypothetical protein BV908_14220 [Diaphorobacter sp. LR2014-1]RKL19995.1 hypothetical protein BFJ72_g15115 [Fusarium proliferatum]SFE87011.1 hypothetical protein SAMN04489711_106181 [Paracidovorax wautersii]NCU65550.1 hypothetical protein [Acidovorax sp. 210-6]
MNKHQVMALSNLRPETVVAVEGVPFTSRALALPGVEAARESLSEVAPGGAADADEGIDVKAGCRLEPDTEARMVVMEQFIVAGGLCHDDDAGHCNPLTEDQGNGSLYHRGRRARPGEEASFFEALGRDGEGNKDLAAECVSDLLAGQVCASIRSNRSLMATLGNLLRSRGRAAASWDAVLKTVAQAIHQEGWAYALDYVAQWFLDVPWWAELPQAWRDKLKDLSSLLDEREAEAAWKRARAAGRIGSPLAVLLDIYEHGGVVYSVAGQGMQCPWDTTRGGAIWVPDQQAEDNIRCNVLRALGGGEVRWFGATGGGNEPPVVRHSNDGGHTWDGDHATEAGPLAAWADARGLSLAPAELAATLAEEATRYCQAVLEEYNAWVNGEVYGVVVYVLDRATGRRIEDRDEECWGFIGHAYAEETLEDTVLSTVVRLGAAAH